MKLTKPMLAPRRARPLAGTEDAWFYVEPKGVSVFASKEGGGTTACKLTRRQLERALEILRAADY